jgi:hypothetical protein
VENTICCQDVLETVNITFKITIYLSFLGTTYHTSTPAKEEIEACSRGLAMRVIMHAKAVDNLLSTLFHKETGSNLEAFCICLMGTIWPL